MKLKILALLTVALSLSLIVFNSLSTTYAAGVVGTGTADSCSEGALDAALAGGGAITFNCGTSPVVINVLKEKDIAQNTMLDGGGLVTISGRNATRVFKVGTGITLEIHKLTVAYGAAKDTSDTAHDGIGGGILNDGGTVTLIDAAITSSRADHGGGGIYNRNGTLTLVRATISGAYASDNGGGILNEKGTVNLGNATLSGNFAGKNGGGIFNFAGTVTITHGTLYNNNAGFDGSGILNNQEGTVALKNTIVANNSAGIASSAPGAPPFSGNCGGTIIDGNKNLQFPDQSCGGTIPVADPQLGTLADNGGFALTHALKQGSPAIDAADGNVCKSDPIDLLDERNDNRPIGAGCDIGAYEFDPNKPGKGFDNSTTTQCLPTATPRPNIPHPTFTSTPRPLPPTKTPTPRPRQPTQPINTPQPQQPTATPTRFIIRVTFILLPTATPTQEIIR